MRTVKVAILALSLTLPLTGCSEKPVQPEHQASDAANELSVRLESTDYRGGEHDQHWHLTTWTLENLSCEAIEEAVVRVSLFDTMGKFLGHHSLTFFHVDPGHSEQQKRLLFLKSETLGEWKPRIEAVQSRRGEISEELQLSKAETPHAS